MNNSILRVWQGRSIRQREDGYFSLTDMAQATGKRVNDWNRLESTNSYLRTLSRSAGIPVDSLVEVNESIGENSERGTWGHRKVAIRFAQWCSDEFAVQVDCWVEELMRTGTVSLTQPKSTIELLEYHVTIAKEHERQLAEHSARLAELESEQDVTATLQQFTESRLQAVEVEQDRFNDGMGHKYSILGWANLQGLEISLKEASRLGSVAARLCKRQGIAIEKINDPRFGKVGLYHVTCSTWGNPKTAVTPQSVLISVFR